MSNLISETGLTIQTRAEILSEIVTGLKAIYGQDINLEASSPDGQMAQLWTQGKLDTLEFIQMVFNSFDPDQATGRVLDMRCKLNGVTRKTGTYSEQLINVVFTSITTLPGLDTQSEAPFTISDGNGNDYYLTTTYTSLGAGTISLPFRAKSMGPYNAAIGTLTTIETPIFGVASVTNVVTAAVVGTNQETDTALRLRRAQSVSLPSQGWHEGLFAGLLELGCRDARIYENITNTVDSNGVPAHGIWVIVDDNSLRSTNPDTVAARAAEIAEIVYNKHNAGSDLKAHTTNGFSIDITQSDGNTFTVEFDQPVQATLHIQITAGAIPGKALPDPDLIKEQIFNYFQLGDGQYKIGQAADSSAILAYLKDQNPDVAFSGEGVSMDGSTWLTLIPIDGQSGRPSLQSMWYLGASLAASTITVN